MISKYEKTNGVKLFALVAVLAMVIAGAAVMMDDSVDAAPEGTTYLSGDITSTQNFGVGTNVVVNGELIIPEGMALIISGGKLTVNAGASIEIQAGGQLIFQDDAIVNINGNITATGGKPADYTPSTTNGYATYVGAIVNNVDYDATGDTGVYISGSITLERGAQFINSAKTTISYGKTATQSTVEITGANAGAVVLNDGASINVTKRNTQISEIANQTIYMNQGATVDINGHANKVTLTAISASKYYTAGTVTINNDVENLYKAGDDSADPKTGAAIKETSNLTFTVTSSTTPALLNDKTEQTKDTQVTVRQYVINIEGTIDAGDVVTVGAAAANEVSAGTAYKFYKVTENGIVDTNSAEIDMPSVTVTGNLVITDYEGEYTPASGSGSKVEYNSAIVINGYMTVSGNVTAQATVKTGSSAGDSTYAGVSTTSTDDATLLVTGSVTFNYGSIDGSPSTIAGMTIIVDGGKITINDADMKSILGLNAKVFAGAYEVLKEDGSTGSVYVTDFDVAVQEAIAAGSDAVYAFAYNSESAANAEDAVKANATVIDTQITIPADMTLYIYNAMVVAENGELILQVDSAVEIDKTATNGKLYVLGKVTDYDFVMDGYDLTQFDYEVKKTTETDTETIDTYTTLKIALSEAVSGDEIQLSKAVTIKENLTIPADVTVTTVKGGNASGAVLEVQSATLTVNGTLVIDGTDQTVALTKGQNKTNAGNIVVNNIIQNAAAGTFKDAYNGNNVYVPGAYFEGTIGETDAEFVTSPAVASANAGSTSAIYIYGKVSMGDITFTEGENGLDVTVYGEVSGNVTIAGEDVSFVIGIADATTKKPAGVFTGSVSYAATAGTATVDFSKAASNTTGTDVITLASASFNDGTATTNTLTMAGSLKGAATVSAGTVYIANAGTLTVTYTPAVADTTPEDKAVLTVASGATLNVPEGTTLAVNANGATADTKAQSYAGLVVDGTLVIDEGTLTLQDKTTGSAKFDAQADINGTMTYAGPSEAIAGILNVTGTVDVTEDYTLTVSKMYVGDADGAAGTVTGTLDLNAKGFIVAYPAANIDGAAISEDAEGNSDANVTVYYVNGEAIMTSYAADGTPLNLIIPEEFKLTGYYPVNFKNVADGSDWFDNAEMDGTAISAADTSTVDDYTAVYAEAEIMNAAVRLSIGPGMSVYIDDVRYTSGVLSLAVGEHSIVIQVNPGYSGSTTVTLGGTAITGGTFTITPEMAEEYEYKANADTQTNTITLSVMGDIAYDTGSSDDGGMGLTEILLIILVVLIVVMAIMVALRLMRS